MAYLTDGGDTSAIVFQRIQIVNRGAVAKHELGDVLRYPPEESEDDSSINSAC